LFPLRLSGSSTPLFWLLSITEEGSAKIMLKSSPL